MNENITYKEIYEKLNSSSEISKIYEQIEIEEVKDGGWAFHNLEHVKNVSAIAEKILLDLNFDGDTIYKCKMACLLHDVGALQGKDGHAERSFEFAKNLFKKENWIVEDLDSILEAIKNHSSGFDTDNIITLSIILADKLDIKKTRISEAGKKVVGNRQYAHIEDIFIKITNNILIIDFITDGMIDIKELNQYYFTEKLFKAIDSFSNKLDLKYIIMIDNKKWDLN